MTGWQLNHSARLNWRAVEIPWDRPGICWDDYAAVVIRSPWDYQQRHTEFLQVLEDIDRSAAVLWNGLEVVRWNITKTYLRHLERRGVRTVPTLWHEPLTEGSLQRAFTQLNTDEVVVKPVVGANADDTYRLGRASPATLRDEVLCRFQSRMGLLQPFLPSVVEVGEVSLFYFAQQYSHAVVKVPASGDFRVQEEHGGAIRAVEADREHLVAGQQAMEAIPFPTLYARVDLARLDSGELAVMELELIEPSLYFAYDSESPARFAAAFDRLMRERADGCRP